MLPGMIPATGRFTESILTFITLPYDLQLSNALFVIVDAALRLVLT